MESSFDWPDRTIGIALPEELVDPSSFGGQIWIETFHGIILVLRDIHLQHFPVPPTASSK